MSKKLAHATLVCTVLAIGFCSNANAQYTKLFSFDTSAATAGSGPQGSLVTDGTFLYGLTENGGTNNHGCVFRIKPDGTGFFIMNSFNPSGTYGHSPMGSLYYDGAYLYGTTAYGGSPNTDQYGNIFKIKPDGTGFDTLMSFSGVNGTFPGANPNGSLTSDGTYLYGMTTNGGAGTCMAFGMNMGCGVIFKIKPDGTGYTDIHDFGNGTDGTHPYGSLYYDGSTFLYGMTNSGGANSVGLIFKIKPDGTGYHDLYDFKTAGDGTSPWGSLISDGTYLYGMTEFGCINNTGEGLTPCNSGTVFKIKLDGTGDTILYNFSSTGVLGGDGYQPFGDLVYDGTFLYGMTPFGGGGVSNSHGEIFEIKPDGSSYSILHAFGIGTDGTVPHGSLLLSQGCLYGMTSGGGLSLSGTFFKYSLTTSAIRQSGNRHEEAKIYLSSVNGKIAVTGEKLAGRTVELCNVLGEKVYSSIINGTSATIKQDVPNGVYFLTLKNNEGSITKKIIVKK